jgi:hypothetical protein
MSANGLKGAEAGKALGDAIATNTVLKELDIAGGRYDGQRCDVEFVQAFSVGLCDNEALTSLDMSSNKIGICDDLPAGWAYNSSYTACYRHKNGNQSSPPSGAKSSGLIAIANAVSDMRAMTSLNLASNTLGVEGAKIIAVCLPKST